MGRLDDAERHLANAVEIATRMNDRPGMALSRPRPRRGCSSSAIGTTIGSSPSSSSPTSSARRARWARAGSPTVHWRTGSRRRGSPGVDVTTSIDDMVSALEEEQPDMRAHMAPDGTVAILFSDIEDSTVLTERLGDERWLQLLREHNAIFREQLDRHDGYEVKSQGDGFMLAFPDPCEALDCAIEVQRAFAERERDDSARAAADSDGPAHGRGDLGGGRLLRQERDPRRPDRGAGAGRRDPRLGGAAAGGLERQRRRHCASTRAASSSSRAWPAAIASTGPSGRSRTRRPPLPESGSPEPLTPADHEGAARTLAEAFIDDPAGCRSGRRRGSGGVHLPDQPRGDPRRRPLVRSVLVHP